MVTAHTSGYKQYMSEQTADNPINQLALQTSTFGTVEVNLL